MENKGHFEKGKPRHNKAGRKKGGKNKATIYLHKLLFESNFDLADEIRKTLEQCTTPEQRIEVLRILVQYFPKPKEYDVSEPQSDNESQIPENDLISLVK
jgi:hypothetical protein